MSKEYTKKSKEKSKEKSTPRRSTISRQVLEFFPSNLSSMVFFLFFLVWDLFSSQLRDVWDEGVLNSFNSNEKIALKL
jgi:hypothetical protein